MSMVDRLAERDAERRAMARTRFWRGAAWAVGGAAVAVAVGWLAFFSPLLALDPARVTVSGEGTTIDVGEVRDEIVPERGVPLPRLDTVALRERVLGLSGVKDVRIMRDWPRGLTVELTSREPVVAVPDGGAYALLDEDAVRVGTVASPTDVPVVSAPLSDDARSRAALFAALDVMAALPPGLAGKVASVTADTQDDVRTRLDDGTAVVWGSGDRLELKARVVTTLRKAEPDARVIDVSSPDLPVTR
ncbi:cell division protein FtsQ/DivIB [Myceligenerans salitolerans]|uniref:Cell division protein FtsQ/DivIB n=2 Tax=Myceligenerans salitolerans TaxID=1230528 RepID=A0ABS3I520_9MICO|nr:cell division protein FtsQ/DivIB [Myceligenerans salitolerans]